VHTPQPADTPQPFDWSQSCPEYATPPAMDVVARVARLRAMFPPVPRQQVTR